MVGNGCPNEAWHYVSSLPNQFYYMRYPNPLGYAPAINKGIKAAMGEYIILLNDDTIILDSPVDSWLKILEKPFYEKDNCGITGPAKTFSNHIDDEFLIFFCVMLSRRLINKIGLLNEGFRVGGGEDLDYCMRAKNAGFSLDMVPDALKLGCDGTRLIGSFPIYHAGEKTVGSIKDWDSIFSNNMAIVERLYLNK